MFAAYLMKKAKNISSFKGLVALCWILLAGLMATESVCAHTLETSYIIEQEASSGEDAENKVVVQINNDAINFIPNVIIEQDFYQIMEIKFVQTDDRPIAENIPLSETYYFKTLFCRVICPNAP